MAFDTSMFLRGYNPVPIESRANALMRGLEVRNQQQGNALNAMKLQAAQQQMAEQAQAAQRQQAIEAAYRNALETPLQQAGAAGMTRPTPQNAAALGQMQPRLNQQRLAQELMRVDPMAAAKMLTPQPRKLMNVGPGGAVIDESGKEVYRAPFKPEGEKTPEALRTLAAIFGEGTPEYLAAARQLATKMTTNAPGVSVSYGAPTAGMDANGNPVFFQPSKTGGAPAIVPGIRPQGDSEKPLSEGQAKAVAFASRMQSADQIMANLARKGVITTAPGATSNSVVGDVVTGASSPEQQQLVQAKRDFINAVLRRESGAVISPEEFENAERQYFPRIGESRPVIEQKAKARRIAIEGMRADVPKGRQREVDRISGAGTPDAAADNSDPLGLRGK